jgi:hypothetical protein
MAFDGRVISNVGVPAAVVGIARVKAIGVRHLIQQGMLDELFPDWLGESYPLYALYPSRHLPAAKVRAFVDFVQMHLQPMASPRSVLEQENAHKRQASLKLPKLRPASAPTRRSQPLLASV